MLNHCLRLAPLLACVAAAPVLADEAPITPYRPSVSSPAQLPAVGQLEYEAGLLSTRTDDARRNSLPILFKLAFSESWGVLLGGEAFVSAPDGVHRARGLGDTSVVLKHALVIDSETAFGLELGAKVPTAKDSIGSGKADYSLNTIFSKDLGKVHMDANANVVRLGVAEPDSSRTQTGLSASFSTPVNARWGVTGELSGTRRSGAASTAQVLVAAAYSPNKQATIDLGVAHGLNKASPDWSLFTGVVIALGKLW